ncbi:MAG TPA: CvpA family protein [Candidatus Dormibacteraeota bacterium]
MAIACYGHGVGAIAASIDSTPGQVFADALLVVAVAVNAYLGWSHGLIRRLFTAVGVFLACFAASNLGNAIAALIHAHNQEANAWAFVAVFLFVIIVVEVLGTLLNERLQKIVVAAFDRIGGVLVGAVIGVAEVLILFLVAMAVSGAAGAVHTTMSQDIHAATLSGRAVQLEPTVKTLFAPVLPTDLSTHFAQNAVVVTPPV